MREYIKDESKFMEMPEPVYKIDSVRYVHSDLESMLDLHEDESYLLNHLKGIETLHKTHHYSHNEVDVFRDYFQEYFWAMK